MKSVLKGFVTVIEYIFYRISKIYDDDVWRGGLFMGYMLWGFVMQPILYLNNVPILTTSMEIGIALLPSIIGAGIGSTQKKRYERLCEKYKYEKIENPYHELCVFLVWGLMIGSIILGIYIMGQRPIIDSVD